MSQLNLLIKNAALIAGSEYKLAQVLGMQPQTISAWKTGRRPCSAPDRAALAGVAGMNAAEEAIEGLLEGIDLESPKGQKAAEALRAALEKVRKLYLSNPATTITRRALEVWRIRSSDPVYGQLSHA